MKCLLCDKEVKTIIAKKLRGGEERNVYYCEMCGLGILDNEETESGLKDFYSEAYRKKHTPSIKKDSSPEDLFNVYSKFQSERINLIKGYLDKKSKLLEIGCSAGMFLFHVRDYVAEVFGIDYDLKSAEFASKICECKVFTDNIEKTDLNEGTFDVICLFQILEHIKNPIEFIKKIKKYLKPNGVLYIEVPNLHDALIFAYDLPNHYDNFYFHPAHLWYFTDKSLEILMEKLGFEGKVFFTQDYNILNHMSWINTDTPQPSCIPGLSSPFLPLRKSLGAEKIKEMNYFIQDVDVNYKKLLVKLGMTSNVSFIGKNKQ